MAELADAPDSKSGSPECGFESHRAHVPVTDVVPYPFLAKFSGRGYQLSFPRHLNCVVALVGQDGAPMCSGGYSGFWVAAASFALNFENI